MSGTKLIRMGRVQKIMEWVHDMEKQCMDEAELFASENPPQAIFLKGKARAYRSVLEKLQEEFD